MENSKRKLLVRGENKTKRIPNGSPTLPYIIGLFAPHVKFFFNVFVFFFTYLKYKLPINFTYAPTNLSRETPEQDIHSRDSTCVRTKFIKTPRLCYTNSIDVPVHFYESVLSQICVVPEYGNSILCQLIQIQKKNWFFLCNSLTNWKIYSQTYFIPWIGHYYMWKVGNAGLKVKFSLYIDKSLQTKKDTK